jgi:outer membrane receptor for ferrienterochelin and colicins
MMNSKHFDRTPVVWAAAIVAIVMVTIAAGPARAQEGRGRITVTVRDNTGVIPGATAAATPTAANAPVVTALTDSQGVAVLDGLIAGSYDVRVTFPGFADAARNNVSVTAGQPQSLDVTLTLPQFSSEVTVTTANRREQLLLDVAEPTVLFDAGQIADTGARTAKDLLIEQQGAGIQVHPGGGQGHVSINGIPNSGVLLLVDGRRILGKDGNGDLNLEDLMLTGVDRVEVVKGAGSALYGSDAVGGVINFITRGARDPGATSLLDISGGTYSDWKVNESAGWRGGRGAVSGSAGYRTYDGFDLSASNPQTIGQPASEWWTGAINGDVRVTERMLARTSVDYSRRDIDNYFFSGATQQLSTVYDSQRELTRYTFAPSVDYHVSADTSLAASYTHGKYERDETRVFVLDGRVAPQAPWREWNDEVKLTASHNWSLMGADAPLQGGFERRQETLQRATLTVPKIDRDISIVWFQQEIGLGSRLRVAAGARYDNFSDFGSEWSPKASAVYRLSERQRLRASAGHGFRPPSFGELYLNQAPVFVGNPDLQPETGNTFDVGYSWAGARTQVSADYYRAAVKNGIAFDLSGEPFTYANLGEYTNQGINTSASVTLPLGFTPSLSYNFIHRKNAEGEEIGGYPKHAAFIKLLWANTRLGLRANIRGQVYGQTLPAFDGTYQPAYQVWYAQVHKRIALSGPHAIGMYVQGSNLFDKRDIFRRNAQGQPVGADVLVWMPPRTFLAGVTLDLDFR